MCSTDLLKFILLGRSKPKYLKQKITLLQLLQLFPNMAKHLCEFTLLKQMFMVL